MQNNQNEAEKRLAPVAVFALIASLVMINVTGQVRKGRRGGGGIPRGTMVRGEEDRERQLAVAVRSSRKMRDMRQ